MLIMTNTLLRRHKSQQSVRSPPKDDALEKSLSLAFDKQEWRRSINLSAI